MGVPGHVDTRSEEELTFLISRPSWSKGCHSTSGNHSWACLAPERKAGEGYLHSVRLAGKKLGQEVKGKKYSGRLLWTE